MFLRFDSELCREYHTLAANVAIRRTTVVYTIRIFSKFAPYINYEIRPIIRYCEANLSKIFAI